MTLGVSVQTTQEHIRLTNMKYVVINAIQYEHECCIKSDKVGKDGW